MPKTTLTLVVPNLDGSPSSPKARYKFTPESQITFHSELISAVAPYFNPILKEFSNSYTIVSLSNHEPFVVKASMATIKALMNENAYHPVVIGSGDTVDSGGGGQEDDGGNTGTGNTGSAAFRGSNSTTFNGACVAATNNDYKHNGSSTLPVAGNKVFLNDGTTLLNDGYYGIAATGSTASAMIRVIAGFVASGYPLQCEELDQIFE